MDELKIRIGEQIRNIIHHFPRLYRLCCMFVRDYGKLYYSILDKKFHYTDEIRKLKDSKKGKRCFVIGNGPSLTVQDLERLKEEDCFTANRIFKIFPETSWRPDYYAVDDWHGISSAEANQLEIPHIFFGDYFFRKHKITNKNALVFYGHRTLDLKLESFGFSDDMAKEIYIGATVTFVNLQIAAYMGYKEIYLLGIDHSFPYEIDSSGKVVRNNAVNRSHFFKDTGATKIIGNIEGMTNAYLTAKNYADKHGIQIYNATRGGKLEVFQRVDFDSLFIE
ncbi:MAG: DUF115 domain-containing protein [Hungatella sp.]|nr:DUF115 domain-containing protein [Hungatella sp.]